MTLGGDVMRDTAIGVGVTDTPNGLSALHSPGCAAVIWRRRPLAGFQHWIDALEPEQLPRVRVVLRPDDVRDVVTSICAASSTPDCDERMLLVDDVAAMADIFAWLMRASLLRLRLEAVTTNAFGKFHIDTVTARLICTYRGTGTQYGLSHDGAEPSEPATVPTGAPIVLRGSLCPVSPPSGLLHRSPPIEGTGETRLVLALDPVESLSPATDQRLH